MWSERRRKPLTPALSRWGRGTTLPLSEAHLRSLIMGMAFRKGSWELTMKPRLLCFSRAARLPLTPALSRRARWRRGQDDGCGNASRGSATARRGNYRRRGLVLFALRRGRHRPGAGDPHRVPGAPEEEVVNSFCRWLDHIFPIRVNHWAARPAPGWHHDPNWTRIFPQYDICDRQEGIRHYWDEYYRRVEELIARYPKHVRLFDHHRALNTEEGLRELLAFVGIPAERQVLTLGTHLNHVPERLPRPGAKRSSNHPLDPRKCVVLVPFTSHIIPPCEGALRELERRGYDVRRVGGHWWDYGTEGYFDSRYTNYHGPIEITTDDAASINAYLKKRPYWNWKPE